MLGENDCRIKHSSYISSSRLRPASSVVSPRSLLWSVIIFSCKCPLPYICCCIVNELLHNSCMPTSKEQSQSLMFYRTVIKADYGWFQYFCVWSTSPKTSLLIKDNSRKNSHIRLRAESELIPLLITQFLKVNFSNVVSSACTASCGAAVLSGKALSAFFILQHFPSMKSAWKKWLFLLEFQKLSHVGEKTR